ncbi:unnamed protein product [Boreogadus saida]
MEDIGLYTAVPRRAPTSENQCSDSQTYCTLRENAPEASRLALFTLSTPHPFLFSIVASVKELTEATAAAPDNVSRWGARAWAAARESGGKARY